MNRLRVHHVLTVALFFMIIIYLFVIESEPTELYKPDNWAAMSIAFGASILSARAWVLGFGLGIKF